MFKRSTPSDRLREISLFAECTPAELAHIDASLTLVHVDAGRVVVREGALGSELLIVVDGELSVTRRSSGGEHEVARLGKGDFFGEMALLVGTPRSATVTALTPAVLYASNPREFATLMSVPSVAAKVRAAAARRLEANSGEVGQAA